MLYSIGMINILRMTTRKLTYLILILFSSISCGQNNITDEEIISDIFPQLIDSLGIRRSNLIPPPPPPIYDKDSNFISIDSIATNQILERHSQLIKRIDSIDSRLLIGLVDSCLTIDLRDLQKRAYLDSVLIRQIIKNNESIGISKVKWNLDLIESPTDFQLMYKSDLKNKYTNVWSIDDRKSGGLIAVSKVYLDKDNKTGLLQFDTYPFNREGASYFVIIERIDKKWKVKRILMNWIT